MLPGVHKEILSNPNMIISLSKSHTNTVVKFMRQINGIPNRLTVTSNENKIL